MTSEKQSGVGIQNGREVSGMKPDKSFGKSESQESENFPGSRGDFGESLADKDSAKKKNRNLSVENTLDETQLVRPGERVDDLQNGFYIIQDPAKFCFGMDAVLLSGFARVKPGERVLDLGTGTGIIPVLLCARTEGEHFTGLEIQAECAEMASRSVRYNGLENRITIRQGDIREAAQDFGAASFHVVTSNPPYMIGKHGLMNPDMPKAIARHEILCTLEDVVSQAVKVLTDRGRFYMVHRPFRLAEIMNVLVKYHLEPKRMQLVYPYIDREPNMVLIEAMKGGNSRITVEKPLIVYERPGVYTKDILETYGLI